MKKLNKILIPSLSTLAIASSLVPLTSCNKKAFDGSVTEQEWKDAFAFLANYGKQPSYWSFSEGDYAIQYDSEEDYGMFQNWVLNPDGMYAEIKWSDGDVRKLYSKYVSGFEYTKTVDDESTEFYTEYEDTLYSFLILYLSTLYDYYSDFKFEQDKYYHYTGSLGEYAVLESKISFNSDKTVSHFDTTFVFKDTEEEETTTYKVNVHPNYEKKVVDYPQDLLDRIAAHTFKLSNSQKINTSICKGQTDGLILDITPDQQGYTKLTAYDGAEPVVMFKSSRSDEFDILKNGELLDDDEWDITSGWLVLTTPLKVTDNVCIQFKPNLKDKEYTFKLEK